MYNFYFESGNQAYIMHLSDDRSDSKDIRILRENTNARDELLRLQKELTIISYNNSKEDIAVRMTSIELNDHEATVVYERNSANEPKPVQITREQPALFIQGQGEMQECVSILDAANNGNILENYSIIVRYGNFSGKVEIVCSPSSQIYDVVLDFGSEASQMLIQRRDSTIRCEPIGLFKGCAKHFYGIPEEEIKEAVRKGIYKYDQQDEDPKLFRSVFFHNGLIPGNNDSIISKPSQNDGFIPFISRRDEEGTRQRIPNVKISYLADINPDGLNMGDLHRGMVMRFIHEALYTIADREKKSPEKKFSLRVTLLVPNVMCQNDVSAFVQFIQESVQNPVFLEQVPETLKLAIVEIRTCSESDASLLNWINKQPHIENGRYLIIDIGKGTTDFSVVKAINAGQAESIFRAGFIGAGNVLSYAILDNYLTHLVGPLSSTRKKIIRTLLQKAEPARLYQLEQAIEAVKKKEIKEPPSTTPSMRLLDPDSLQVETLIEQVESNIDVPDDYNIISDFIYKIVVKEIIGRIKNIEFDHVVLSGRAFKYKPLYNEICKDFKTIFPKVKIHYDASDAKKGCLYGPLTPIAVSKFSNMVGEPKSVDISIIPQASVDIDERLEDLKKSEVRNNLDERKKVLKNIMDKASEVWHCIFPDDEDENGNNSSESMADSLIQLTKEPESTAKKDEKPESQKREYSVTDIMSKGIPIQYYGENTRIYISGNSYIPQSESSLNPNAKYSIYFDGEDFYLRSAESCHPLRKDTTLTSSSPLLFGSLFPYSIQLLGNEIEIPIAKAKKA